MNIPQNKSTIKERRADLDGKANQVILQYAKATDNERRAVIGHIDSFLPTKKGDSKKFWLKFRRSLERINEQTA